MTEPAELTDEGYSLIGRVVVYTAALEQMTVAWAATLKTSRRHHVEGDDAAAVHGAVWRDVIGNGSNAAVTICRNEVQRLPKEHPQYARRADLLLLVECDVSGHR